MLATCRNNTFAIMFATGERASSGGRVGRHGASGDKKKKTNVLVYVYQKQITWQVGQRLVQLPPRHCSGFCSDHCRASVQYKYNLCSDPLEAHIYR